MITVDDLRRVPLFRDLPDGTRVRIASAKQTGFAVEWIEPAYDWIEGRFVRGSRQFTAGPAKSGGFSVELTPDPEAPDAATIVAGDRSHCGTAASGE